MSKYSCAAAESAAGTPLRMGAAERPHCAYANGVLNAPLRLHEWAWLNAPLRLNKRRAEHRLVTTNLRRYSHDLETGIRTP